MSTTTIFISRHLAVDSPLLAWAEANKEVALQGTSLLDFTSVSFQLPVEETDWLFFYSSRAFQFFLKGLPNADHFPRGKVAAMGAGTAKTIAASGFPVDFCGKGIPERVAQDFLILAWQRKVLFPRASQSRRSIEKLLSPQIMPTNLVVYQNLPAPQTDLKPTDIVILTSPLNVAAYFSSVKPHQECKFIALGPSTAKALAQHGLQANYPVEATEMALLPILEQLL